MGLRPGLSAPSVIFRPLWNIPFPLQWTWITASLATSYPFIADSYPNAGGHPALPALVLFPQNRSWCYSRSGLPAHQLDHVIFCKKPFNGFLLLLGNNWDSKTRIPRPFMYDPCCPLSPIRCSCHFLVGTLASGLPRCLSTAFSQLFVWLTSPHSSWLREAFPGH